MASVSDSQEQAVLDSAELEVKKKRLLEELESALVPKDGAVKTVTVQPNPPIRPSLGIEVIDETALLDSVANNGGSKQSSTSRRRGGAPKNKNHNNNNNNNGHGNGDTKSKSKSNKSKSNSKSTSVKKYSLKEMEALRFVNMAQQRKFWKAIRAALETAVANEYDTLAASHHPPYSKPILSVAAANGRCRYMNVFVH